MVSSCSTFTFWHPSLSLPRTNGHQIFFLSAGKSAGSKYMATCRNQ